MSKEVKGITKNKLGLNGLKGLADPLNLFASKKGAAPEASPEAVMPTVDDEAVAAAKRRKAAQMQARGGRESTILTNRETLGG